MAGLVLFAATVWSFHAWWTIARVGRAWFSYDSAQYALAARDLAQTGRLTTPYAYIGTLREGSGPPYPLLAGHPLLPVLQAPLFAVLGPRPWVSLVPVVLCHLLTVSLAALLVVECGGGIALAAVVGAALAGTPALLGNASDGLSELPFTAAWMATLLVLAGFRRAPRAWAVGALLGLAHLARPMVVPTLPLWLAAAAWASPPGTRWRGVTQVLAGFAPFAVALLLYKWSATGNAFADVGGIMLLTGLAPEFAPHDVARLLHPPDALGWIRAHPGAFVAKLSRNLPAMSLEALRLGGWAVGCGFAWFVLRPARDGLGPVRLVAGASLAAIAGLAAVTLPRAHYLFPMLPVAVALGALALQRAGRAARLPSVIVLALVAGLLAWSSWRPLVLGWRALREPPRAASAFNEREVAGLGAILHRRLPAGTRVASDMAPWVSWYTRHPSVNLPLRTQDLNELRDRHGIGAVVLTNEWLVSLPGNEAWRDVFESRAPIVGWTTVSVARSGKLQARVLVPDSPASAPTPRPTPASRSR